MKVILNKCYGGIGFSHACYKLYAKKKGFDLFAYDYDYPSYKKFKKIEDVSEQASYYLKKDYGSSVHENRICWNDMLYLCEEQRDDPVLVECVEELGKKANGRFSKLVVVEIPDGMKYVIDEYDGIETLHEDVPCW